MYFEHFQILGKLLMCCTLTANCAAQRLMSVYLTFRRRDDPYWNAGKKIRSDSDVHLHQGTNYNRQQNRFSNFNPRKRGGRFPEAAGEQPNTYDRYKCWDCYNRYCWSIVMSSVFWDNRNSWVCSSNDSVQTCCSTYWHTVWLCDFLGPLSSVMCSSCAGLHCRISLTCLCLHTDDCHPNMNI